MKLAKYLVAALFACAIVPSCYEDNGNYDYTDLPSITISGIESSYTVIAGIDNFTVNPTIETEYDAADMEYVWELWNSDNTRDTLLVSNSPRINSDFGKIGNYTVYFYAKNTKNGYYTHTKTTLLVNTEFSQGFYILKETSTGDTDLDLLLMDGRVATDILERTQGSALGGAPRHLGIMYGRPLVDPETDSKTYSNCLGLITYDKNVNILRAKDMYLAFDRSTMYYDYPSDETPYRFNTGKDVEYYSSKGIYHLSSGSTGSGYMSFPTSDPGAGDHFAWTCGSCGMVYWDDVNCNFMYNNMYSDGTILENGAYQTTGLTAYECIYMGGVYNNIIYAILRTRSDGTLVVYKISAGDYGGVPKALSVTTVPRSSKLYDAKVIGANEVAVAYLFFTDSSNKLYYVNMNTTDDGGNLTLPVTEVQGAFFPSDETVTYISNQYYGISGFFSFVYTFNYFAVATYKNGNYNIYMYNWVGGLPSGEAVRTASGKGKVKSINYLGTATSIGAFDLLYDAIGYQYVRWTR